MPKNVLDMNVAELEQLRAGLNPDDTSPQDIKALDDHIITVKIQEGVTAGISQFQSKQEAQKLDEVAYKRWPKLRDKESEFYKKVNEEMEARGAKPSDKHALFDAANAVGFESGEVQEGFTPSENTQAIMKIKSANDQDAGSDKTPYTESKSSFLDVLTKEGFLNKDNAESMERINQAGEDQNNG